ncbi:MAG TPA: alpha/beta hydrolase-fold protein [Ignavibacteriaceae bacterium]|nr:alpha/beta hydrolase-fold protein [Ignavibacteriaceae bacterium]
MERTLEKNTKFNYNNNLSASLENWNSISENEKSSIIENINLSILRQNYPIHINDSEVILLYKGNNEKVELLSDLTGWKEPLSFNKVSNPDFFFLKVNLEPDARIQYLLLVDGNPIVDPYNKYQPRHGLGAMSELAMPKYERHPYLDEFIYGKEGSFKGLKKHILPAGSLPYEHEIYVYLPEDYDKNKKYPTIYFHDGPDYIRYGVVPSSLKKIITDNLIEPCIAVFVTPPNLHQPKEPNRSTEYGLNDDYVKFFCDELVPFIDSNYNSDKDARRRIIIGDSYAGLISFYIAFVRNDIFANAYSQSGYFSFNKNRLINLFRNEPFKNLNLMFDVGTYEKIVGADFIPPDEQDFTKANRVMKEVLQSRNYSFVYNEYHDGHLWGSWRKLLINALIHFLGVKK